MLEKYTAVILYSSYNLHHEMRQEKQIIF